MALPAGVVLLGTFKGEKGDKGNTGVLANLNVELLPWDSEPYAEMTGPAEYRGATVHIPLPLPGPETVNNDDATELLILNPTKTQAAIVTVIGDGYTELETPRKAHAQSLLRFDPAPLAPFHDAVSRAASSPVVVVTAGDSVTEGWNATAGNAWPDHLARLLAAAFPSRPYAVNPVQRVETATVPTDPGVHIVNAGVAGTVSNTYLTPTSRDQVMALKPSLIIHQVGFNDWRNSVTVASYKIRVRDQILALKALQTSPCAHLLVLAYEQSQPHGPAGWWEYGRALAEVAAEFSDVAFLDYSGAFHAVGVPGADPLGLIDTDDLHATNAGHYLIGMIMADTLSVRASTDPALVAADTFAGLPGGVSFTEKGSKPWSDLTPTFATWTRGGGVLRANKIASANPFLIVGTGHSDGKVAVTFDNATYESLLLRFTDTSNHLLLTISSARYRLFKRVGGALTELAQAATVTPTPGDRIEVTLDGPSINVSINGTNVMTVTDAFNVSAKQYGFWVGSGTAQTVNFSNFQHTA